MGDAEGEQWLRSPPFLNKQMVEDDVLWLWSLNVSVISVPKDRHEKLGWEGGRLLGEFLVTRVLQVVTVFGRWGCFKLSYTVEAFWNVILSKTSIFSDEMGTSTMENFSNGLEQSTPHNLLVFGSLLFKFLQVWMLKQKYSILTDMDIEEVGHLPSFISCMR